MLMVSFLSSLLLRRHVIIELSARVFLVKCGDHGGSFWSCFRRVWRAFVAVFPKFDPSFRFFGNRGAVAGTFTLVAVEVVFICLMMALSYRLYRKNQRLQARAQRMRVSQNRMYENPFSVDSPEYRNTRYLPSPPGHRHNWGKKPVPTTGDEDLLHVESECSTRGPAYQQFDVGDDALREGEHPYLAGSNPGFILNYLDWDDPEHLQAHLPESRPPPYDKGPTTGDHSLTTSRSKAYSLFPDWRRFSGAPPSPSVYSAGLPVAGDGDQAQQPATRTSVISRKNAAVPNHHDRGANSKRLGSIRALVDTGTYMMTPLDLEDDRGCTAAPLMKPPSDRPCQIYPPSVPPKSPLRALRQWDLR